MLNWILTRYFFIVYISYSLVYLYCFDPCPLYNHIFTFKTQEHVCKHQSSKHLSELQFFDKFVFILSYRMYNFCTTNAAVIVRAVMCISVHEVLENNNKLKRKKLNTKITTIQKKTFDKNTICAWLNHFHN